MRLPVGDPFASVRLMKFKVHPRSAFTILAVGVFSLSLGPVALTQEAEPEKARALLDQTKKSDLDRQIAVKETEMSRLKEDQDKTQRDSDALTQTNSSTSQFITDSLESLNKLSANSKRLEHEVVVTEARISAERAKVEGLRALSAAQEKSLAALGRRAEEADARTQVRAAELELLRAGKPVPSEGNEDKGEAELAKRRKALSLAIGRTQTEERLAREAMKAAAGKMATAETRAATVKRLAEIDPSAPPKPAADKPKEQPLEKAPDKIGDLPVRRALPVTTQSATPSAVRAAAPSKPAPSAKATPKPAAKATPQPKP